MSYDYKKEFPDLYRPKTTPSLIDVPEMRFLAVRGRGDPNEPDGEYHRAMGLLYAAAFTLKMSRKAGHDIPGWFEYTVPPLEGFWWQPDSPVPDLSRKSSLCWVSLIRQPEFITEEEFSWARSEVVRKKNLDCGPLEFLTIREGLCVQCLHLGPYDEEQFTLDKMDRFTREQGLEPDFSEERRHHEIYLGDPRRCAPEKLRTVLRCPVRPARSVPQS